MTGFGTSAFKNEKISLNIQIKSVNGRFLETRFRMPREYSSLEGEIKKKISKYIQRGTLDISIYRTIETKDANIVVTPNISLAKAWVKACQELASFTNLNDDTTFASLLRVPDMMQISGNEELQDWEKSAVYETVEKTLEACLGEKRREGEAQFKTFSDLLDTLEKFITDIKKKKKIIDSQLLAKLGERLKALADGIAIDPQRLAQEAVFLMDKADIEEELIRAETHIKAYRLALNEKVSVGKKLEFYTQELHREINTMGSKTQALEVTLDVIEAKTCIERLREQVQNVE